MVDNDTVSCRLDILLENLQYLEDIVDQGFEVYQRKPHLRAAVERYLLIIAQSVTDIATHIVASQHLGTPESYSDAIMRLVTHGIIPQDLAERLSQLIKMRNVIVHLYARVDPAIVFQGANQALSDVIAFVNIIRDYLKP
ncbi:MAG: type VII toxin-antitoxin system HepT family RNase toxin [Candidatus Thorarchaeota archaeon]